MRWTTTLAVSIWALSAFPAESGASPQGLQTVESSGSRSASDYAGEKVSMSLRDADLVEVLRSFARLGDLNMILHPGIQGSVTVELKEVPWDQAMAMILKLNGLGMDLSGNTLHIAPPDQLLAMTEQDVRFPTPPLIPTIRVRGTTRHLDHRLLVQLLNDREARWLTDRGRAEADGQGRLTIEDVRSRLNPVAKMVAALDRPGAERWDVGQLRQEAQAWWQRHIGSGGF